MLLYGTRLCGYSDKVDGVGHVATRFFHIWWVPLIPVRSYLMVEGHDDRGVEIPMRGKSVLAAWVRTAFILGGIGMLVGASSLMSSSALSAVALLVAAAASFVGFWAMGRVFERVSLERRFELLADAGIADPDMVRGWQDLEGPPASVRTQQRQAATAQRNAWSSMPAQQQAANVASRY
jgi:hypothetical protein